MVSKKLEFPWESLAGKGERLKPGATWEVTLHGSDKLSDSFAMETGAEIRMGQ